MQPENHTMWLLKNQKGVIYPIHEIQHASLITTDQLLFFKNIPFFNPSKIILFRHPSNIMLFLKQKLCMLHYNIISNVVYSGYVLEGYHMTFFLLKDMLHNMIWREAFAYINCQKIYSCWNFYLIVFTYMIFAPKSQLFLSTNFASFRKFTWLICCFFQIVWKHFFRLFMFLIDKMM